jgi:hypothetical protein
VPEIAVSILAQYVQKRQELVYEKNHSASRHDQLVVAE